MTQDKSIWNLPSVQFFFVNPKRYIPKTLPGVLYLGLLKVSNIASPTTPDPLFLVVQTWTPRGLFAEWRRQISNLSSTSNLLFEFNHVVLDQECYVVATIENKVNDKVFIYGNFELPVNLLQPHQNYQLSIPMVCCFCYRCSTTPALTLRFSHCPGRCPQVPAHCTNAIHSNKSAISNQRGPPGGQGTEAQVFDSRFGPPPYSSSQKDLLCG